MSIELQRQINDLNERLNKLSRVDTPLFWDGTNVGIGGTPAAKLDVVNGYIRARNGTNIAPTSGAGLEMVMTGSIGYLLSYSRDTSSYLPLNLFGNGVTIGSGAGSLRLDISGVGAGAENRIEVGANATGSRYAYIDLHGDDTYTDYSSRFIRENTGVNASTRLQHRGTGEFSIESVDAANIALKVNGTTRFTIDTAGNAVLYGSLFPANQGSYYIGFDGSSSIYTNGNLRSAGNYYPGNQTSYYWGYHGSFSASVYANTHIVSAGKLFPSNQATWGISWNGNAMLIDGNIVVGAGATGVSGGAGIVSLGNTVLNFNPTGANWASGGTTLLLSASDYSSIGFHDAGSRVDFIRVGAGVMQLGYNGGFGNAQVEIQANTGIGDVPATSNKLRVRGIDNTSSNGALIVQNAAGTTLMQNRDDNVNQVGTAWVVISDESTKDDIAPLPSGLNEIKQLKPKKYSTKAGNHKTFGLVAQDVQTIFPDMVIELDEGVLGLRYNDLIPVLVNAVIELNDKIEKLEKAAKPQNK